MDDRLARTLRTYEDNAERYAATNADRSAVDALVDQFLDALDGGRVLDVGCGPGWETARLAEAGVDVVGLDISPSLLAAASDRAAGADLTLADVRSIPFRSGTVDGVWACASLVHLPRDHLPDALAELSRVLRPDGLLAATVKSVAYDDRTDDYDGERHFEYYEPDAFERHVERAGFDVTAVESSENGWLWVEARAR